MLKQLVLITIFLLLSVLGFSQQSLDSLKSVWTDNSLQATTRLDALSEIINHAKIYSYIDSIGHYSDIQIDFALQNNSDKHLAHGLFFKAWFYASGSDIPLGISLIDSANAIYQNLGDVYGITRTNSFKGVMLAYTGNDEGFDLCEQAYKKAVEHDNLKARYECADNLNAVHQLYGNINEEIRYVRIAVKCAEEIGNWVKLADSYHRLADVYLAMDITDDGMTYHELALEYCRKSGYVSEEVNIIAHMAALESKRGNHLKALEYISTIEAWQMNNGTGIAKLNFRARKIYFLVLAKQYEEAKQDILHYRSTNHENVLTSAFMTAMVDYSEGKMLLDLGQHVKAVDLCLVAYEELYDFKRYSQALRACECLYDAYKALDNHERALEFHEKHQLIEEKLNKEQVAKDLQRFELHKQAVADSLEEVEEDRLVELAHVEEVRRKDRNRNIAFGSGFLLLIFAAGLYSRLRYVRKSKAIIEKEKDRSENLLLNILPEEIAAELKEKGKADARDFEMVSILFTDFKEFTQASEKLTAQELVTEINTCFEAFDGIMTKYNIEKIKTIGDAYMAAGGLPVPTDNSVKNTVLAALEMQSFISNRKVEMDALGMPAFEMRVGIHTGPVVAGIVGVKKFQYDIWGDTVNTASRIESNGKVGKVNISQATYEILKNDADFSFESRGKIDAKGKGEINMYFIHLNK